MNHRKDFEWLVLEKLGKATAASIDWSAPRLICVAGDFNRYDDHAVRQVQRNIDLIRYRRFGQDLVMLDLVTAISTKSVPGATRGGAASGKSKSVSTALGELDPEMRDRFDALRDYLMALGEDVQETILHFYIAFCLQAVARTRARSARSARAVPSGSDGDVASFDEGEQAGERRRLAAGPSSLSRTVADGTGRAAFTMV